MARSGRDYLLARLSFRFLAGVAVIAAAAGGAWSAEWPSALNLSTLDGASGFRLDGVAAGDVSGFSVSDAGDMNGDGFGDIIIGAYLNSSPVLYSGTSYVVFGRAGSFPSALNLSTLNGTTGFKLSGSGGYDSSGRAVSKAGDVNGDGFGDVIIGAWWANPNGQGDAGSSYVVFGKASGFTSEVKLSALNGTNGFRLDGVLSGDQSGVSVSGAGDVNKDGFDDVIIGANLADNNGNNSGSAYVYFGKAGGFASAVNLSSLNGTTGFRLDGGANGDQAGFSVSEAGDFNGDGLDDVIIGAYRADPNAVNYAGTSYVLFGKTTSFDPVQNLSTLDGTQGIKIFGAEEGDFSGFSVAAAGDVNGDGRGDVVLGGPNAGPEETPNSGIFWIVNGQAVTGSHLALSALNAATGFRFVSDAEGERAGWSVTGKVDINCDGFDDVIGGAQSASVGSAKSGSTFVVFGGEEVLSFTLSPTSLDGTNGVRINGVATNNYSGISVSSSDFNGDGFPDVLIGAKGADNSGTDAGSTYSVFGRAPDAAVTRIGSEASQRICGSEFDDVLQSGGGEDKLIGRGGGDQLISDDGLTWASYVVEAAGIRASLGSPESNTGDAAGDTYVNIANLEGSRHADTLTGNGSGNRLAGGKGLDKLKGGGGKDSFEYRQSADSPPGSAKRDQILDFNPGTKSSAVDKIDLSGIDAKTSKGGNQAFTFRGTKAFNGSGQVRLKKSGNDVIIQGNTGGSKSPEFEIVLKGLASKIGRITAKDFRL